MLLNVIRSTATICLLLVWSGVALAQSDAVAPAPERAKGAADAAVATSTHESVQEVHPAIFFLPDKQGRLQPVLDFSYQDFVELYRLKHQLTPQEKPPTYVVQKMEATGAVAPDATLVELTIHLQILVREGGWVRVPLKLDQALLHGEVRYQGDGKQFLDHENDAGYVCWLFGDSDSKHELQMTMLVPITSIGEQWQMRLTMPHSATSEMKLTVPAASAVGKVSEDATLVAASAVKNGATEFNILGLGGDFSITWRKEIPRFSETPVILEANAIVLTRFDGHSQTADATLSVRSHGAAFDRFSVRLPPEMELATGPAQGYSVTPLDAEPDEQGRRSVEVRFPKKTIGPAEVRISCRRSYDPTQNQAWCELAGFDVIGAARQWGATAVAASSDWQVLWGVSSETRQTDQLPDVLRKADVIAGFEYATQPYLLSARLVPRRTRINMEPSYVLLIDRDGVRLEGTLTYAVRGAKTAALDLSLPGWKIDEVGPDALVAVDGIVLNDDIATIPLLQPTSGTFTIQLRAHRAVAADGKSLSIPLPQMLNGVSNAASVAVVPADNVDLTPNAQAIEGLVRQRIAPPMRIPERQQEPLYYRGTGPTAVFAADMHVLPQRITADAATQITIGDRVADIEQRLTYSIAHEPMDRLTLAVPRDLATTKRIQILCDGKPLSMSFVAEDNANAGGASAAMRVALPGPRIGNCELSLQYSLPIPEPAPGKTSATAIPLPMPVDGQLLSNTLAIKSPRNMHVALRKNEWALVDRETIASNGQGALLLSASTAVPNVELDLRTETDAVQDGTIIDRAWIQSWITTLGRQDRAVYQLATSRKEIEVVFPAGAVIDHTIVDGKRVERRAVDEDRWAIPLNGQREGRRVVVELRYHFQNAGPRHGAFAVVFPKIGNDTWVRRMFWQLVLPSNEHLVVNPSGFTAEFQWNWQGYFLGREPTLDQEDLESWGGATPRDPLPERANVYLFSALGSMKNVEVRTATRSMIVLCASGVSLVFGLLFIYVPITRHPATMLLLGLTLAAAGMIAPEPALLLAQASGLGLVLALFAGLLERSISRRHRTIRPDVPSAIIDAGSTRTPRYVMPTGSHASVEVAPTAPPQTLGNADP